MRRCAFFHFQFLRILRKLGLLALIILCLSLGSGFAASSMQKASGTGTADTAPFTVVVVIPKGAGIHYSVALSMVSSMDSFQSICTVVRKNTEEEARQMLDAGEAKAAVLIPDGMIHGIMYGDNLPATIIYPQEVSEESVLFRNLVEALSDMMGSSQAGIYSLYDIYAEAGMDEKTQNKANSEINSLHIDYVLDRASQFTVENAEKGDETPLWLPFAAGGIALLLLLSGAALADYYQDSAELEPLVLRRQGTDSFSAALCTVLSEAAILSIILGIVLGVAVIINRTNTFLPGLGLGFLPTLLSSVFFASSFHSLVLRLTKTRSSGVMAVICLSVILVFLAGGMLPLSFLPTAIRNLSNWNPVTGMVLSLRQGLSGSLNVSNSIKLFFFGLILTLLSALPAHLQHRNSILRTESRAEAVGHENASGGLNFRLHPFAKNRLAAWLIFIVRRKITSTGMTATIVFMLLAGVLLSNYDPSDQAIPVAVWAENPDSFTAQVMEDLLSGREGALYSFYLADSENDLHAAVLSGQAECGFIFPDNLLSSMNGSGPLTRLITGSGTTLALLVREQVFESMFGFYVPEHLYTYIEESNLLSLDEPSLRASIQKKYTAWKDSGETFRVEYEEVTKDFFSNAALFAIDTHGALALLLFAVGFAGISQFRRDLKQKKLLLRTTRERHLLPVFYSLIPMLITGVAGLLFLGICGDLGFFVSEVFCLLVYISIILFFAVLSHNVVLSELAFDLLIPGVILFSLLYAPVLADLSSLLPAGQILSGFSPAVWYMNLYSLTGT